MGRQIFAMELISPAVAKRRHVGGIALLKEFHDQLNLLWSQCVPERGRFGAVFGDPGAHGLIVDGLAVHKLFSLEQTSQTGRERLQIGLFRWRLDLQMKRCLRCEPQPENAASATCPSRDLAFAD